MAARTATTKKTAPTAKKRPAKASTTPTANVGPKKPRSTAYEMLQALQAKRDELSSRYEFKISQLDAKIAKLVSHRKERIEVDRLKASYSAEELASQADELARQLRHMKAALRKTSIA